MVLIVRVYVHFYICMKQYYVQGVDIGRNIQLEHGIYRYEISQVPH